MIEKELADLENRIFDCQMMLGIYNELLIKLKSEHKKKELELVKK